MLLLQLVAVVVVVVMKGKRTLTSSSTEHSTSSIVHLSRQVTSSSTSYSWFVYKCLGFQPRYWNSEVTAQNCWNDQFLRHTQATVVTIIIIIIIYIAQITIKTCLGGFNQRHGKPLPHQIFLTSKFLVWAKLQNDDVLLQWSNKHENCKNSSSV